MRRTEAVEKQPYFCLKLLVSPFLNPQNENQCRRGGIVEDKELKSILPSIHQQPEYRTFQENPEVCSSSGS